jgi:ornithine cyclodeaminase/alanine dehydrogenase-like protein (mu-crystallin family)
MAAETSAPRGTEKRTTLHTIPGFTSRSSKKRADLHYFDEETVSRSLSWDALIMAMESVLADFSRGALIHPVRSILTIEERQRYLGIMPAVVGDVMGVKIVTFYPANAQTPIPTHQATVVLYRTDNGGPLAAMDGRLITEMRTAAVSAAVTKQLASPDSRVLALLGSGVQAHSHLAALAHVRTFSDVRVWSRTAEHARRFAREHRVTAVDSAYAAVRDADVIVTATAAHEPILKGEWLKRGAHVNAVGSSNPNWRELDDAAMANTVIVDSREAALKEAGDVILSGATIYAEAGEIFAGTKPATPERTTIFKSVGLACEDIAAARLVVESA